MPKYVNWPVLKKNRTTFYYLFSQHVYSLTHKLLVRSSKFKKLLLLGIKLMVLSALSNNMVAMDRRLANILGGGPHYEGDGVDHQLFNGVSN